MYLALKEERTQSQLFGWVSSWIERLSPEGSQVQMQDLIVTLVAVATRFHPARYQTWSNETAEVSCRSKFLDRGFRVLVTRGHAYFITLMYEASHKKMDYHNMTLVVPLLSKHTLAKNSPRLIVSCASIYSTWLDEKWYYDQFHGTEIKLFPRGEIRRINILLSGVEP